jgi:hypothetical protein
MTKEQYYAYMDEFMQYYYGPGWTHIKSYMEQMTAHAIKHNPHVGIFDKGEKMFPFKNDDGKKDTRFARGFLDTWAQAYAEAQTDAQRDHVEKSSIQIYYYCSLSGGTSQRKEYLKKVYELCEKYGIEYYKYVVPMPDSSQSDNLNSLI